MKNMTIYIYYSVMTMTVVTFIKPLKELWPGYSIHAAAKRKNLSTTNENLDELDSGTPMSSN